MNSGALLLDYSDRLIIYFVAYIFPSASVTGNFSRSAPGLLTYHFLFPQKHTMPRAHLGFSESRPCSRPLFFLRRMILRYGEYSLILGCYYFYAFSEDRARKGVSVYVH